MMSVAILWRWCPMLNYDIHCSGSSQLQLYNLVQVLKLEAMLVPVALSGR